MRNSDCLRIISSDIYNTKNAKHLIVHTIHSRVRPAPMMNPSESHLVVTISLLNAKGDPLEGYHRCLVEFKYVINYIGKHQGTKHRYLFCHVSEESVGDSFNARTDPLSTQQFIQSQQHFLSQLSHNSGVHLPINHGNSICYTPPNTLARLEGDYSMFGPSQLSQPEH